MDNLPDLGEPTPLKFPLSPGNIKRGGLLNIDITPELRAQLLMNYRQLLRGNVNPGFGMSYQNGPNEFGITSNPNRINFTFQRKF